MNSSYRVDHGFSSDSDSDSGDMSSRSEMKSRRARGCGLVGTTGRRNGQSSVRVATMTQETSKPWLRDVPHLQIFKLKGFAA